MDYTFGPGTVGTAAVDHKPFLAAPNGSTVGILFEDLADFPGATSDWDYNDRQWGGVTASPVSPPVVATYQDVWGPAGVPDGPDQVTVHQTVTQYSDTEYRWEQVFTNTSAVGPYSGAFASKGIDWLETGIGDAGNVTRLEASDGWSASPTFSYNTYSPVLLWQGSPIMPGESRTLVYYTRPLAILQMHGYAISAAPDREESADGQLKAPGPEFDLDVNANGTLTDAVDRAANYLPGYEGDTQKVSTGKTFKDQQYVGQKMKLIVNGYGLNQEKLKEVQFTITVTSAWAGYASNGKDGAVKGENKEWDYSFDKPVDLATVTVTRSNTPGADTGGKMEGGFTWAYFWAKDYGGKCIVTAKVYYDDPTAPDGKMLKDSFTLAVPKDDDNDNLADKWERAMGSRWKAQYFLVAYDPNNLANLSPDQDGEFPNPDGQLTQIRQIGQAEPGDAHTVLGEYRGYLLDGGGPNAFAGGHLRLDPARKEYLVEIDRTDFINNASIPTGGLKAAMDRTASVFSNTATDANGREKGAGIYMYYVFDETSRPESGNTIQSGTDVENLMLASRDTVQSRSAGEKNLRTDFVHLLFMDRTFWAGAQAFDPAADPHVPAPVARTDADNANLGKRGTFVSVSDLKDWYLLGVQKGYLTANKWDDFFSATVAHELTHLLGAKPGTAGFNANGHTTDPDEDGVVNAIPINPTLPLTDPDDAACLMYDATLAQNRELATVKFFNLVKRILRVQTSDGLDP